VGFCDITGQTNERSMLAAHIPVGVVCGNKVPTITFQSDMATEEDLAYLWLAVANSLPFDWLLRRTVTTTVNYFILLSMPFPRFEPDSPMARKLVGLSRKLAKVNCTFDVPVDAWKVAEWRAEVDVCVAAAYGLGSSELAIMTEDFPLLDRGQPPLPGEVLSTVTRDLLALRAAEHFGSPAHEWEWRVGQARRLGAVAYVPSVLTAANRASPDEVHCD
jgi:hypothetical protein